MRINENEQVKTLNKTILKLISIGPLPLASKLFCTRKKILNSLNLPMIRYLHSQAKGIV